VYNGRETGVPSVSRRFIWEADMDRRTFVASVAPLIAASAASAQPPKPMAAPPSPEKPPLPRDDAEKKILDVLDDLDKNQRAGNMNVPVEDGRLLRILAEFSGAKHVVELGTSNGYSGIWFCLALRHASGKLTTSTVSPS
jgi:hypothetical protein